MKECFKCGISGNKVLLFDAISEKGIVEICKKCLSEERIPLIKKPTDFQLKKVEQKSTTYERLSKAAGIDKKDYVPSRSVIPNKQEVTLRDIVDKNLKIKAKETKKRDDLIENFHWIIMRTRRSKHLSQKQLAETIAEPEQVIKMVEKGITPENNYLLINKLENYLGIKLKKESIQFSKRLEETPKAKEESEEIGQNTLSFDPITTKTLTISDLQEMKRKKEEEILYSKDESDIEFEEEEDLKDFE